MRTSARAELTESIAVLRQAVDLDPTFALALSELSRRHQFEAAFGDQAAAARGIQIAHKAIEIDPQLGGAPCAGLEPEQSRPCPRIAAVLSEGD